MSELRPVQMVPGVSALIEIRVSTPDADTAQMLAKEIVGANLAACVQCLGPMTSIYTWQGRPHQTTEWLLLIQTTEEMFQEVSDLVAARHRYETPEIIAVPVSNALGAYEAWVRDAVLAPRRLNA